jgi:hypothetical protein
MLKPKSHDTEGEESEKMETLRRDREGKGGGQKEKED